MTDTPSKGTFPSDTKLDYYNLYHDLRKKIEGMQRANDRCKQLLDEQSQRLGRVQPDYLGDGVYASVGRFGSLVITTEHHDPAQANNVVYLEDPVVSALLRYIERAKVND